MKGRGGEGRKGRGGERRKGRREKREWEGMEGEWELISTPSRQSCLCSVPCLHLLLRTSVEVPKMTSDMVSVSICCIRSSSGRLGCTPSSCAHSRTATPPLVG